MKTGQKISLLIGALLVTFAIAALGSAVTTPALSSWYMDLAKPVFNPPNWIFAPVWTFLYIAMAVAAYLVLISGWKKASVGRAVAIYSVQLSLNLLWSLAFFGFQNLWIAFAVIVLLWISIVVNLLLFWRVKPIAGWLLVPYLLWVTFASVLNGAIAILN